MAYNYNKYITSVKLMLPERGFYWRKPRIGLSHGVTKTSEMRNLFRTIFLEPVVGFKPTAYALQVRCSIN